MADLESTLKSLGGNRLKIWLSKPENQEKLKAATTEQKLYIMEKWSQTYEGAPFPFELITDGQSGNAAPDASEAAPPPDAQNPPASEKVDTETHSEAGNGSDRATAPEPEDSLFGTGNIPEGKRPAVLMTEQQRYIANLVASAAKDAPHIESVEELKTALQMLVPKPIKRARPGYTYKWTSLDNLQADLAKFGGIWEIVTRVNHSHLSESFFGDEGAIMWKGASVLTFTRKEITEQIDKEILREFNFKADQATSLDKSYGMVRGKEAVRLTVEDRAPQDRAFGEEDITIHDPDLANSEEYPNNPEDYYDYGDTGAPM